MDSHNRHFVADMRCKFFCFFFNKYKKHVEHTVVMMCAKIVALRIVGRSRDKGNAFVGDILLAKPPMKESLGGTVM